MSTANRWRATLSGSFASGPWSGEIAQLGFAGWVSDNDPDWIGVAIDTPLPTSTVNPGGGIETVGGLGTVSYGAEGAGASGFSKANQKAIFTAMQTYADVINNVCANTFAYREMRLSAFQADGHVINGATVCTLTTPLVGSDASHDLPPQTAIVQSLRTNGRGSRNRGRWYIPIHSNANTATGGTIGGTFRDALNAAAKAMYDTIEALTHIGPAVVSPQHQSFSQVVEFAVGDRYDTQRRRANAVIETRSTLTN